MTILLYLCTLDPLDEDEKDDSNVDEDVDVDTVEMDIVEMDFGIEMLCSGAEQRGGNCPSDMLLRLRGFGLDLEEGYPLEWREDLR